MDRAVSAREDDGAPLLLAGAAAAVLYVAIMVVAGAMTPGYSHVSQPVSSLYQAGSQLGGPVAVAFLVYNVLVAAFGFAIVRLARSRGERMHAGVAAGIAVVLVGVAGALDDVFPQDPIGSAITSTGTLHIVFAGVASLLTVAAMALAAWWLLGRRELRPLAWYSIASLLVVLVSGPVTAAATASGSPVMGLAERVTILTFTLWMAVLSVVLARTASLPRR
jgi:hypothetical protein